MRQVLYVCPPPCPGHAWWPTRTSPGPSVSSGSGSGGDPLPASGRYEIGQQGSKPMPSQVACSIHGPSTVEGSVKAAAAVWVRASRCQLREGNRVDRLQLDAPGCRPKRGAAIMSSHFMDELAQFASDVREYATEVRRMGYSPVAAGDENPFLELSDRMILRVDKLNVHTHSH